MWKVLVVLCMSVQVQAAWDFSGVQPFDDKVKEMLVWSNPEDAAAVSDWTNFAMIVMPFAMQLDEDKVLVRLGAVGAAYAAAHTLTDLTKSASGRMRPNGSDDKSFFSGHTSSAFVGAGVMCLESEKACGVGLSLAAATAYFRVAGNKHWATDVLVGAAIGFASGSQIPVLITDF